MVKISRWRKLSLIFVYIYAVSLACKLNAFTLSSVKWYGTFQHNVQKINQNEKKSEKMKSAICSVLPSKPVPPHKATKYIFLNGRLVHIHKVKRNNYVVLIYTVPVKKGKLFLHSWLTRGTLKNWQNYGKVKPKLPMVKARIERECHRALCQASWRKNILSTAYCVTKQLPECRKRGADIKPIMLENHLGAYELKPPTMNFLVQKNSIKWRSKFAFDGNFFMKERLVVRLGLLNVFFFSKRKRKNKGR